jgi:acyl dehydratase
MMGLFLHEIILGEKIALGSYGFTSENIIAYSRQFDPVGFHVDEAAGKVGPYGALTAAGLHVGCGWMTCYVAANTQARAALQAADKTLPEIGPSPGFKNMHWLKPVFAGDALSYFTTATAKRPLRRRQGWGIVIGHNEGVNQNGELVFSFESAVLTALNV